MKPVYWVVAVVLGVACAAGWTYLQQHESDVNVARVAGEPRDVSHETHAPAPEMPSHPASAAPAVEPVRTSGSQISRWLTDVDSTDAATRAAAITALAQAPRAQALPVLRRVLLNGEPSVDRPLALKSLRELAIAQGDTDDGVRQAMREVIYHGDDEQLAVSTQEALEAVEQSEQALARR